MKSEGRREKPEICERTFRFAVEIVNLCRELDQTPGVSRTLANQLLRSGTPIGANIEEGQGGHSKADFIAKYGIARKEARETLYWLRLLAETKIAEPTRLAGMLKESDELVAILTAIIKKARGCQ